MTPPLPPSGPDDTAPAPRRARTALAHALVGVALAALVACTPLYLPPQPGDALVAESRMRLAGTSRLAHEDSRLVLTLDVVEVPHDGWLAVQWFGPAGGELASESLWLTPADVGTSHALTPPEHAAVRPGDWRAIVSWYGAVVRQFRVEVAEADSP